MKTKLTIVMAFLTIIPITLSANNIDTGIKKQCQYLVYGNGSEDIYLNLFMSGIVTGIDFMIDKQDKSTFSKNSNNGVLVYKTCQNTLNDISSSGFLIDFKWHAYRLMKKR